MILRDRQKEFVDRCEGAIKEKKNTLGIAPTGAGKTVMMAGVADRVSKFKDKDKPSLILQHRDELVTQNARTFVRYMGAQSCQPKFINADHKAWDRRGEGFNFAMVQTLIRNLDTMPVLGAIYIDEAHHVAANSYIQIIDRAKKQNPNLYLYGTTATPNRGDKKSLLGIFDNCADQISISELISDGHLVRPRTFVIDIGTQDALGKVKRTATDFDMSEVEAIMNKAVLNEQIVQNWKNLAGTRQTVVFCSTIQHAKDLCLMFQTHGVHAAVVDGDMSLSDRRAVLEAYDRCDIQVLLNVMVLTEGWDNQPTSCVVLTRPASWKSTMIQMIGRGLRKVDPEKYPGVTKDDCIVLDFGTSVLMHGSLEDTVDLKGSGVKTCPECSARIPDSSPECPICGYEFPRVTQEEGGEGTSKTKDAKEAMTKFVMTEVDILDSSPFRYESFYQGMIQISTAFTAWAAVITGSDGRFYAVGGAKDPETNKPTGLRLLADSKDYIIALQSADDFMRENGDSSSARKSKRWLTEPPSDGQMSILSKEIAEGGPAGIFGLTKYRAACMIELKFNFSAIGRRVMQAQAAHKENIAA